MKPRPKHADMKERKKWHSKPGAYAFLETMLLLSQDNKFVKLYLPANHSH
jgi:hypothetical protein